MQCKYVTDLLDL